MVVSLTGGVIAVVVFQLLKRSQILEMADSCLWWTVVSASLTAQERILKA